MEQLKHSTMYITFYFNLLPQKTYDLHQRILIREKCEPLAPRDVEVGRKETQIDGRHVCRLFSLLFIGIIIIKTSHYSIPAYTGSFYPNCLKQKHLKVSILLSLCCIY